MKPVFLPFLSRSLLMSLCAFTLNACVNLPYQAPTQQGNVIEAERAQMIQKGMSRSQIASIAGVPITQSIFHKDRWDYVYTLDEHATSPESQRISIWFAKDIAIKIERVTVSLD